MYLDNQFPFDMFGGRGVRFSMMRPFWHYYIDLRPRRNVAPCQMAKRCNQSRIKMGNPLPKAKRIFRDLPIAAGSSSGHSMAFHHPPTITSHEYQTLIKAFSIEPILLSQSYFYKK